MRARQLVAVGVFLAATGANLAAIRAFVPDPYVPLVSEKFGRLEELRDEVNVLFVGSSLVYRHLSPIIFDDEMASRGQPTRSFNLGLPGAFNAELLHGLRRVRDMRLPHLRYVLIETSGSQEPIETVNVRTPRVVYWHESDETRRAVRAAWSTRDDLVSGMDRARLHVFAFLLNRSGASRLRLALDGIVPSPLRETARPAAMGPANDGFAGLKPIEERKRLIDVDVVAQGLEDRLRDRRRKARRQVNREALTPAQITMFVALDAVIRELGAEPVHIVSPIVALRPDVEEAVATGLVSVLIDFNDPSVYPEFYKLESRADGVHLNYRAAALYSRRVATRFANHLGATAKRTK